MGRWRVGSCCTVSKACAGTCSGVPAHQGQRGWTHAPAVRRRVLTFMTAGAELPQEGVRVPFQSGSVVLQKSQSVSFLSWLPCMHAGASSVSMRIAMRVAAVAHAVHNRYK